MEQPLKPANILSKHAFLSGAGETGRLISEYDWSETSLGTIETWPQSLQTTLGLMLHSAFPMFLFWGEDLICFYNDAYRPSLGIDGKHPAIGKKAGEVWPEIWEFIGPLIDKVLNTAQPVWFEDQLVPIFRNGKIEDVWWTFSYSPVYGDSGEVAGVFVTCTETTDKVISLRKLEENEQQLKHLALTLEEKVKERTAEIELNNTALMKMNADMKQSEERYHRMISEVQDYAIILLNKEGIIQNWNRGAERIKGYKAEEIIGKSFSTFYTEEDRKNHVPEKLLDEAKKTGRATDENYRVRKDGTKFWGSVVITALHDNDNNVIGYVKVTRDLTERKISEEEIKAKAEQLEAQNIQLQKMNKELESFAYISSHDLQEPLRKIQTFATRISEKENQNLSASGKEMFHRMQLAAKRMQTLIDDLLTYSRTNTSERKFETTDINKIIQEVTEDLKEEIKEKKATIEATGLCKANIIPFQFRQMMHNLIGNALKFSKPETTPYIRINSHIEKGINLDGTKLSPQNKYCHISVTDNGIGFEKEYREKIFEVFQRLHGKTEYSGTGIGLAIVKKIVENHEGIITATSELNKGATFDIFIPVT